MLRNSNYAFACEQIGALIGIELSGGQGHGSFTRCADGKRQAPPAWFSVIPLSGPLPCPKPCLVVVFVLQPGGPKPGWTALLSAAPKLDFARAAALIEPLPKGKGGRHPTAFVSENAVIGDHVDIGPYVGVGPRAEVGAGSILYTGVVIGEGCRLGENCILYPNTVLYPGVQLRDRVILHAGVIVGADGFGYIFDGEKQVKFPQSGRVIIDDDVEIGANTTIDRGSLGTTRIGQGSKIDNLVQIAHNVEIGRHVVIAAQTGISGSTVIEATASLADRSVLAITYACKKGRLSALKPESSPGKLCAEEKFIGGFPSAL